MRLYYIIIGLVMLTNPILAQPNPYIRQNNKAIYLVDQVNSKTSLVSDDVDNMFFLTVDSSGLYYAINGGTRLEKSDLDGGNRTTLWQGSNSGIAGSRFVVATTYDFKANKGYITSSGTSLSALEGNYLFGVDLNSGQLDTLIKYGQDQLLTGVGVDALNQHLYFARKPGGIYRVDLNGQNEVLIISDNNFIENPSKIAIDSKNQMVYWVEDARITDAVRRVKFDGSGFETIIPNNIKADLGVHFDFENEQIYARGNFQFLTTDLNGENLSFIETEFKTEVLINNDNTRLPFFTLDDTYFYRYRDDKIVRTHRTDFTEKIIFHGFQLLDFRSDNINKKLYFIYDDDVTARIDWDGGNLTIYDTPGIDETSDLGWIIFDKTIIYDVLFDDIPYHVLGTNIETGQTDTLAKEKNIGDYLNDRPYITDHLNTRADLENNKLYTPGLNEIFVQNADDGSDRKPFIFFGLDRPGRIEFNRVDKRVYWVNFGTQNPGLFSVNIDGTDTQTLFEEELNGYLLLYPDTPNPPSNLDPPLKEVVKDKEDPKDPDIILSAADPHSNFNIYPNPAHDYISLENVPSGQYISITDLSGKALLTDTKATQATLDITSLNPGLYQVIIYNQDEQIVVSGRFTKQ